ncbi:hypothetical protein ABK040_005945 [Willaertia magna]
MKRYSSLLNFLSKSSSVNRKKHEFVNYIINNNTIRFMQTTTNSITNKNTSIFNNNVKGVEDRVKMKTMEIVEAIIKRIERKHPDKKEEMKKEIMDWVEQCKDDEDYHQAFTLIAQKIRKLKKEFKFKEIINVFHSEFLPIYKTKRSIIIEKIKTEIKLRRRNTERLPRVHNEIFAEHLDALSKLGDINKMMGLLSFIPYPTSLHVLICINNLCKQARPLSAVNIYHRFKKAFLGERSNVTAKAMKQAFLYIITGFERLGCYKASLEFIEKENLIPFINNTNSGKLLAKIVKTAIINNDLNFAENLINNFLSDIDSPEFRFMKAKQELTECIFYYNMKKFPVVDLSEIADTVVPDSKAYQLILLQLCNDSSITVEEIENFCFKTIPPNVLSAKHLSVLMKKYNDNKLYEKTINIYEKLPLSKRDEKIYSEMLDCYAAIATNPDKSDYACSNALKLFNEFTTPRVIKQNQRKDKQIVHYLPFVQYRYLVLHVFFNAKDFDGLERFFSECCKYPTMREYELMLPYFQMSNNKEMLEFLQSTRTAEMHEISETSH